MKGCYSPSPVSGTITEIIRGERRKILEIRITPDAQQSFHEYEKKQVDSLSPEQIKEHLLQTGCWPLIKQRPYDVIASVDSQPKAIFISACKTKSFSS